MWSLLMSIGLIEKCSCRQTYFLLQFKRQSNKNILQVFYFQLFVTILMVYRSIFAKSQIVEYRRQQAAFVPHENMTFKEVPLPFESYIPFYHDDGISYYLASSFQIFGAWLFGLYISCIDAILCGYVVHSNAQLLILKNSINLFLNKAEERFVWRHAPASG